MSSKLNVILIAILAILGGIISISLRGPRPTVAATAATTAPLPAPATAGIRIQVQTESPVVHAAPTTLPAATPSATPAPAATLAPTPATAVTPTPTAVTATQDPVQQSQPLAAVQPVEPTKAEKPDTDRVLKYTARPGDNVSVLAAGLLGADSKTNRDAIISENKSLQNDPDHVVSGKTYKIPTSTGLSAATVARPATQPDADDVIKSGTPRELRYTARAGDSVSRLAEVLLGSDTQANRDAIIGNNPSLKADPDRVVAGQTYLIPAPTPVQKP